MRSGREVSCESEFDVFIVVVCFILIRAANTPRLVPILSVRESVGTNFTSDGEMPILKCLRIAVQPRASGDAPIPAICEATVRSTLTTWNEIASGSGGEDLQNAL